MKFLSEENISQIRLGCEELSGAERQPGEGFLGKTLGIRIADEKPRRNPDKHFSVEIKQRKIPKGSRSRNLLSQDGCQVGERGEHQSLGCEAVN
jgi:hypothetical protein